MTNPSFQVAAAHIRQGVQVKRQAVNDRRAEIDQKKRQLDQDINRLKEEIRAKEQDITRIQEEQNEPDKGRAEKTREITELHAAIVNKQHEFERERDHIAQDIQQQESELADLERQANDLLTKE